MKKIISFVLFLFLNTLFSQTTLEEFVEEGIQFHQAGEYEKSIEAYKKALEIDPNSSMVLYEMAYSYLRNNNLEKALSYADRVLEKNDENKRLAYMVKGSALDLMGKTVESNELFKQAIQELGPHYLFYYNMGFNYFKAGDYLNAETHIIKALEYNPNHPTSHYLLASIHNDQNNKVQAILAAHYFLLIEPDSDRSLIALEIINKNTSANVTKDANDPKKISINLSANENDPFGPAEMMMSLLEASKSVESNEGKTPQQLFAENTKSFFTILGELNTDNEGDIWWDFYIPFYFDLAKSEHIETYCKYITQVNDEEARLWLEANEAKLSGFGAWLNDN